MPISKDVVTEVRKIIRSFQISQNTKKASCNIFSRLLIGFHYRLQIALRGKGAKKLIFATKKLYQLTQTPGAKDIDTREN